MQTGDFTRKKSLVQVQYRPPNSFNSLENAVGGLENVTTSLEELGIRELLETLLTPDMKRKLKLRRLPNGDLFLLYKDELRLRRRNDKDFRDTTRVLEKFHDFLGEMPPSPELAKSFLTGYSHLKPSTLARHTGTIRGFMEWMGEEFDLKVPLPKQLRRL